MEISTIYPLLFFLTIPYLYVNRAWLCDNCMVQQLSKKLKNINNRLNYVLTVSYKMCGIATECIFVFYLISLILISPSMLLHWSLILNAG